ncbi:MAG: sulfotransferase, partial [Sphingomonadales bacterium]
FADLIDAIYREYAARFGKVRWGDKTPFYTPDIDILWNLFPGCRIIHLVRDGRDVAVSQRKIGWLSSSIPRLAEDWRWKTTVAHKVGSVLGEDFLEIRYEDLVVEPETVLRCICAFLGEEFDPEMLGYHDNAGDVVPADSLRWHRNSIRPPDPSKLGTWKIKMSRADRTIYEQIAGQALEEFGYEREYLASTFASRARALYFALIKRW